jgi:hypothetical protein
MSLQNKMLLKNTVFWNVTPCGSCKDRGFEAVVTANVVPSSPILVTYDGGDMFLRNIGSYKTHTASHLRRRHSS